MKCEHSVSSIVYIVLQCITVSLCDPKSDEYSILSIPTQADSALAKLVLTDVQLDVTESPNRKIDKGTQLDCESQRRKSQSRKDGGDTLIYIPSCNARNQTLYQAVQCHDSTKYCWCVHVVSGEPIPGSTTLVDRPRCAEERPPKKEKTKKKNRCNGSRRARFLRRLVASLKTEMIMAGNDSRSKVSRDTAIQWKFAQLDKNKNKLLERSEWRPYKAVLLQWKRVRHCSRSLFKSCDLDSNKRLSPMEWKQCIAQGCLRLSYYQLSASLLECRRMPE